MKILSAQQISALDQATMEREPISSIELMERAASKGVDFITENFPELSQHFTIFCGPGNNGGDGWVIARLLHQKGYSLQVIDCKIGQQSPNNLGNYKRFNELTSHRVSSLAINDSFPVLAEETIIIDALFGTG